MFLSVWVYQSSKKKNQDLKTEELQFLMINSGQSCMLYKVSFGKEQQEGEVQICVI